MSATVELGAWIPPSGHLFVSIEDVVEGACCYCEEPVVCKIGTSAGGMTTALTPCVWRYRGNRFELWHVECLERWTFTWVVNASGRVHIEGCRHADADGRREEGTRGEILHGMRGQRERIHSDLCSVCAPIGDWPADFPERECPLVAAMAGATP